LKGTILEGQSQRDKVRETTNVVFDVHYVSHGVSLGSVVPVREEPLCNILKVSVTSVTVTVTNPVRED